MEESKIAQAAKAFDHLTMDAMWDEIQTLRAENQKLREECERLKKGRADWLRWKEIAADRLAAAEREIAVYKAGAAYEERQKDAALRERDELAGKVDKINRILSGGAFIDAPDGFIEFAWWPDGSTEDKYEFDSILDIAALAERKPDAE